MNEPGTGGSTSFARGEQTRVWCHHCETFRSSTWDVGDLLVEGRHEPVHGVLRAGCDSCGTVVALGAEATPVIREALQGRARKTTTTIRVQKSLVLRLNADLVQAGIDIQDFDALVKGFVIYLRQGTANWKRAVFVLKHLDDPILADEPDEAIAFHLRPEVWYVLERLEDDTAFHTAELVRRFLASVSHAWAKESLPKRAGHGAVKTRRSLQPDPSRQIKEFAVLAS